jgi:hypothetical protein
MKIKLIEEPNGLCLTKDKIYEVINVNDYSYVIINDNNEEQAYFTRRFEIVEM